MGGIAILLLACEQRVQLSGDGCDSSSCAGCCTVQGCVLPANQNDSACGSGGAVCGMCGSGTTCSSGACRTVSNSCSNCSGCCSGTTCVALSQQSDSRCGADGASCRVCSAGSSCVNGSCETSTSTCGPCAGCCYGTLCRVGNELLACGGGGGVCAVCAHAETCISGRCERCGPSNCQGCCDSLGTCQQGDDDFFCGVGGASCRFCMGAAHTCVGHSCQ